MSKLGSQQSDGDPESFTVLRKKGPAVKTVRTAGELSAAQRSGATIETSRKQQAGGNAQHQMTRNAAKIDAETEQFKLDHVGLDVGRIIQQARQAKEWSQKELATKVNEKPQVINEYESGKAVPNQQILAKLERTLMVKLRGKEKGQPMQPRSSSGSTSGAKKK